MQSPPYFFEDPQKIPWLISAAATVSLGILGTALRRLRATTLRAPILWCMVAAAATMLAAWRPGPYVDYCVAVLFVAPTLALLGAKRPQNVAWQFIVLTLVGVLMMPVLQGWAYGDREPHVHVLFRWILAAHVVFGLMNFLITRYAGPAIVLAAAQSAIAFSYLPMMRLQKFTQPVLAGGVGMATALVWVSYIAIRRSVRSRGLQRLWLDFRDAYGAVWALRVAERLNAAAKQHGWPVEFTWGGILVIDRAPPASEPSQTIAPARPSEAALAALPPEVRHRVERELRSMLRRFVSHEWIVRRLETGDRRPET